MDSMRKSRLSHYKQDRLAEHFASGSTAKTTASLCGVNRKTAAFFFLRLREIIAYELECEWRFNNSDPSVQLSQLRQWVKRHLR